MLFLVAIILFEYRRYDTEAEIQLLMTELKKAGAYDVVLSKHWALGSDGSEELAKAVARAVEQPSNFKYLYELDLPLKTKIETIAKEMYGAGEVRYSDLAEKKLKQFEEQVRFMNLGVIILGIFAL